MINISAKARALLAKDNINKNLRIHFINSNLPDITNENIKAESLRFYESICSKPELQFGLCESPYIEFETFGIGKIKGEECEASLEMTVREKISESTSKEINPPASSNDGITVTRGSLSFTINKDIDLEFVVSGSCASNNMQTFQISYVLDGTSHTDQIRPTYQRDSNNVYNGTFIYTINAECESVHIGSINISNVPACYYKNGSITRSYRAGARAIRYYMKDVTYSIPLGSYIVSSCKKLADMNKRKVIAYAKTNITDDCFSEAFLRASSIGTDRKYRFDIVKRSMAFLKPDSLKNIGTATAYTDGAVGRFVSFPIFTLNNTIYYIGYNCKHISLPENTANLYTVEAGLLQNYETLKADLISDIDAFVKTQGASGIEALSNDSSFKHGMNTFARVFMNELAGGGGAINAYSNEDNFAVYPFLDPASSVTAQASIFIPYKCSIGTNEGNVYTRITDEISLRNETGYSINKISFDLFGRFFAEADRVVYNSAYYIKDKLTKDQALKYIESAIEILGKFGKTSREGKLELINLKSKFSALYPSETLYPSNSLYPSEVNGGSVDASNYRSLWYDDDYTLPIKAVECAYNDGTNDLYAIKYSEDADQENNSGYRTYSLSSNALIKASTISTSSMNTMLQNFLTSAGDFSFMPSEVKMHGRPDLEAGDVIEITTASGEALTTMILKRSMTGINNLIDSISST